MMPMKWGYAPGASGACKGGRSWTFGRAQRLACVFAVLLALCYLAIPSHAWAEVRGDGLGSTEPASVATEYPEVAQASSYEGELGRDMGFLPSEVDRSDATSVTIARLAGADESLDGELVTFRGEVVGEPVSVAGGKWVQLESSDAHYILVFMTDEQAAQIANVGSYQVKGTTLLITGIYRLADPDRMGDMDVTAYQVRSVDAGGARTEEVELGGLWVALALIAIGGGLTVLGIFLRRRSL